MKSTHYILCLSIGLAAILLSPSRSHAAFGVTDNGTSYVVDSGAGLIFKVQKADGDITSIQYNDVEYQYAATASHLVSGLGGGTTVSAEIVNTDYIKVTLETASDHWLSPNLSHYFLVKRNDNTIYMATYITQEPNIGECRWITRLQTPKLPYGPIPSDMRNTTGIIESADVFSMADGTTRSKYYGDEITHAKDRAMDLTYCGVTGENVGIWMIYGNRESSSGGPFYRDIQEDAFSANRGLYNYMNSGHAQTEDWREEVLHGPYALVFNDGSEPAFPLDFSWIADMALTGYVADSGRGTVSGTATGVQDGFEAVVGFSNTEAQYWATVTNGFYTSPLMKPGTYTITLYQQEFKVDTETVTVTAGSNATKNLSAASQPTVFWRLGERDGTPAGLLNADKVIEMHPSDVRMGDWTTAASASTPYIIGGSTPRSEGLPCYQWQGIGSQYVQFDLTAEQVVNSTIRIGITTSFEGGRPGIEINGLSTYETSYPDDMNSRSMTICTWRGVNFQSTFSVSSGYLHAGSNILKINAVSGSGWTAPYLSPGFGIDYIEMSGPTSTIPPSPTGLTAIARDAEVEIYWDAVDWAQGYVLERATAPGGPYTTLSSDIGPARFTDSTSSSGTTYYYRVSAINAAGTGMASEPVSTIPESPDGLAAEAVSSSRINLSWSEAIGAVSYTVKRATNIGGPYTIIATNITSTTYPDIALTEETTYYYVVSAVNSVGESDNSDEVSAATFVEGFLNSATDSGTATSATISGFDLKGGNALAVLVSGQGPDTSPSYTVTYGGQSVTDKIFIKESYQAAAIFYWIDPTVSNGDVVVTFDGSTLYSVSALSLDNVSDIADSASFGEASGTGSYDLTYDASAGGVVVASFIDNDWQGGTPTISGDNIDTYLQQIDGTDAGRAHAYGSISSDGSFSETFTWGAATSDRNAGALAAFNRASDITAPIAPTGLHASAGDASISLDWNDNGEPDLASYTVYRSTTSGSGYSAIATELSSSEFTDYGLVNGTPYYYVVTATDTSDNESTESVEASATPEPQPPAPPAGLTVVSATGAVSLDWSDNAETNLTGYTVYRSKTSGSGYMTIATGVAASDYTDTDVFVGATYYYVVSAVNDAPLESDTSYEASAIVGQNTSISVAGSNTDSGSSSSSSTISGFGLNGGNALVVLISGEGADTSPGYSVTYGGNAVTDSIFANQDNQAAGIFYWINPSVTTGDVVVSFDSSHRYAVSVMSLSNVAALADSATLADGDNSPWNLNYSGKAGGVVAASFVDNVWDAPNGVPTIAGDNIDTYLQQIAGTGSDSAGRAHAYGNISVDDIFTETFTSGDSNSSSTRNAGALAAFAPLLSYNPTAPSGLNAYAVSTSRINLAWTSSDADTYTVKRSTSSGGIYTPVATGITATNYSDMGLPENSTYYYKVSAVNAYGESDSVIASATTLTASSPNMGITVSNGTMILNWPVEYRGWTLEYQTNLLSTNAWIPVPDSELTNVFDYGTMTDDKLFFRLANP